MLMIVLLLRFHNSWQNGLNSQLSTVKNRGATVSQARHTPSEGEGEAKRYASTSGVTGVTGDWGGEHYTFCSTKERVRSDRVFQR